MPLFKLPILSGIAHQSFEVTLDGVVVEVELRWNNRDGAWYASLLDSSGELLVAGRKLVAGLRLIKGHRRAALPPGEIFVWDTSGASADPGPDDLGTRVLLVYADAVEMGG